MIPRACVRPFELNNYDIKKLLPFVFAIIILGVLAYILIPAVGRTCRGDAPFVSQYFQARSVALAASSWMSTAQNGKLRVAENLDVVDSKFLKDELRQYEDFKSGQRYDWLYYGAYVDFSEPTNQTILVAVPQTHLMAAPSGQREAHRIVAYLDGHTDTLLETEFQQKVEAMLKEKAEKQN